MKHRILRKPVFDAGGMVVVLPTGTQGVDNWLGD